MPSKMSTHYSGHAHRKMAWFAIVKLATITYREYSHEYVYSVYFDFCVETIMMIIVVICVRHTPIHIHTLAFTYLSNVLQMLIHSIEWPKHRNLNFSFNFVKFASKWKNRCDKLKILCTLFINHFDDEKKSHPQMVDSIKRLVSFTRCRENKN